MFSAGTVVTEDGDSVSLQQKMMFFSGAEKEPPLGFAEKPRLEFIEGDFAMTSTCLPTLRIQFCHRDYTSFVKFMTLSLIGHDGFGFV